MPLHPLNANGPISVRLSGGVSCVMPLHPKNAPSPIAVRSSGRVSYVMPLHLANAYSPIFARPRGRTSTTIPVLSLNASPAMRVTPRGTTSLRVFLSHWTDDGGLDENRTVRVIVEHDAGAAPAAAAGQQRSACRLRSMVGWPAGDCCCGNAGRAW